MDDGLISGLREDQLVTAEEVDSAVREVGANIQALVVPK